MYKNRLQEICQQRGWPLPEYAVSRDGPDHNPCFGATVSVNGLTFDAPDASTSSKDAQGKAALAAVDYLSAASSSGGGPPAPSFQCSSLAQGNNPMYKSQLEEICRQRMWSAPDYSVNRDGPDHNPRFRATVTVNGANFDAPDLSRSSKEAQGKAAQVAVRHFALMVPPIPSPPATHSSPSVREAEHDAAKVALVSLSLDENAQEETILYKNLLQELLQKEGFSLPKYSTASDGASHMPIFSSVVEIEGESFVGDVARSKKQAEVNAAKVALNQLKERFNARSKSVTRLPPGFSVKEHLRLSSLQSESITIKNLEQGKPLLVSYDRINEDRAGEKLKDGLVDQIGSSSINVAAIREDDQCEKLKDVDQNGSSSINVAAIREDNQCEKLKGGLMDQIGSSSITVAAIREDDQCEKLKDGLMDQIGSSSINVAAILEDDHVKHSPRKIMVNNDYIDNLASSLDDLVVEVPTKEEDRVESILFEETASNFSKQPTAVVSSEISAAETTCSLCRNRVQVYPRKPDMVLPKGASFLPFSNDMWVAVSLDSSNDEMQSRSDVLSN